MSNPSSSATDQFLHLPDGRRLGYAEYGVSSGRPVLFFQSAPGSRYQVHVDLAAAAARQGVRLIAPERPGCGLSDPQPGRNLRDWAADVAAMTDTLGIERFSIIAFSIGGIYALVCAHDMPARVERIALAGGLAPADVPGLTEGMSAELTGLYALAQSDPQGLRAAMTPLAQSPAGLLAAMLEPMPDWDKMIAGQLGGHFAADFAEALRHGVDGIVSDLVLASRPWGFSPEDIQTEVHIWQGTEDRNAPPAMAKYLATVLPRRGLFMLPGEGHLSLFARGDEILARLIQ